MSKHYYCPYCGETQFPSTVRCVKCRSVMTLVESKYDSEYYREKSLEQYGDYTHWRDFFIEEVKQNPLFDERKFNYQPTKEQHDEILKNIFSANQKSTDNCNVPKCPTCGSTNVSKISTTSKVVGGAMFGLFSKTALSQFKCNNCGYKW